MRPKPGINAFGLRRPTPPHSRRGNRRTRRRQSGQDTDRGAIRIDSQPRRTRRPCLTRVCPRNTILSLCTDADDSPPGDTGHRPGAAAREFFIGLRKGVIKWFVLLPRACSLCPSSPWCSPSRRATGRALARRARVPRAPVPRATALRASVRSRRLPPRDALGARVLGARAPPTRAPRVEDVPSPPRLVRRTSVRAAKVVPRRPRRNRALPPSNPVPRASVAPRTSRAA